MLAHHACFNYRLRYIMPQLASVLLGQLDIVTTLEAALTFKSTIIVVNLN